MTERTHTQARCEDCNKVYRVPDPDRTYPCKACGGTVRVAGEREVEPEHKVAIDGMLTCKACHAVNPRGGRFCVECNGLLSSKAEDVMTDTETARLRHDAAAELRSAHKAIGVVSGLYWTGAVLYTFATAAAVLALAQPEVPLVPGVIVVVLTTSLSVLLLMGATHILFRPFLWTLVIALLATCVTVVHLLGPNPYGVAFLGSAAWAVAAWAALLPTRAFARTMGRHQDLYILHHASKQTRRSLRGEFARERHARLLAAMRRASRRAWKVSTAVAAAIVLASGLGTYLVTTSLRAEAFAPVLAGFETAWSEGGVSAVQEFFHPRVRATQMTLLQGVSEGHGWGAHPPVLADGRERDVEGSVWVDYATGELAASTRWTREGQEWFLVEVDLPPPPLEPSCEHFVQAWEASDAQSIVALFSPDSRNKMLSSINGAVRSRGWTSYPKIRTTVVENLAGGRATVHFELDESEVTTDWHLRNDGTWGLNRLRFPER